MDGFYFSGLFFLFYLISLSSHKTSQDLSDWSSSFCAWEPLVLQVLLADWKFSADKSLAEEVFLSGVSQPHELWQGAQDKQHKKD